PGVRVDTRSDPALSGALEEELTGLVAHGVLGPWIPERARDCRSPAVADVPEMRQDLVIAGDTAQAQSSRLLVHLFVEFGRMAASVARRFVVVDPQLRMLVGNDPRELFHRGRRLRLVGIEGWDATMLPVGLKMHGVARQDDVARFPQANEQGLVSRGVARRRQNREAAVAKEIFVPFDQLRLMLGPEGLQR